MEQLDHEAAENAMQRIMAGDLAALDAGPKPPTGDELPAEPELVLG